MGIAKKSSSDDKAVQDARKPLFEARHLPGHFYVSAEIFQLELQKIFFKDWLAVARAEQIAKPGDYMALQILGEPVLLVRNHEGVVQAFANTCRHRGAEIASGKGNRKQFECPYHKWLYDLNGKLVAAPKNEEVTGFDFGNCRLPPIKCDSWGGYIFINFDPESAWLGAHLNGDSVLPACDRLNLQDTLVGDETVCEIDANWKFVSENLVDLYHATAVQDTPFGGYLPEANGAAGKLTDHGYHMEYGALHTAPGSMVLLGPLPWFKDKPEHFAFTAHIAPNFHIFAKRDLIQSWAVLPISHERTRVTIWTQYAREHFDMPAFKQKNEVIAARIKSVVASDAPLLRSLHAGARSRAYVPGPLMGQEYVVHHKLGRYLDRLFED
jgi:Rieske 2Fe-2S family protein